MIAGIGASAGGVEAASDLLSYLPANLGIAYVVVQHLSPKHENILPEILQKKTTMKVQQVKDRMLVLPDHVYVIPPDHFMSITKGRMVLFPRVAGNIAPHTIDYFLNALAPVYQNKAIAIILSGMATDGTAGVQSIKASAEAIKNALKGFKTFVPVHDGPWRADIMRTIISRSKTRKGRLQVCSISSMTWRTG